MHLSPRKPKQTSREAVLPFWACSRLSWTDCPHRLIALTDWLAQVICGLQKIFGQGMTKFSNLKINCNFNSCGTIDTFSWPGKIFIVEDVIVCLILFELMMIDNRPIGKCLFDARQ
jgi:hypothetical protein